MLTLTKTPRTKSKYKTPKIGFRSGMLTYVGHATYKHDSYGRPVARLMVKCDCGITKPVNRNEFLSKKTTSCGCQRGRRTDETPLVRLPAYKMWQAAIQDGVTMCREWRSAREFCKFFAPMMAVRGLQVRPVDDSRPLGPNNFVLYM